MSECKCDLRTRLVGDGCQYCNPDMHVECLEQKCADLEDEIKRLRVNDEEREAVWFMLRHAAHAADIPAFLDSADYIMHHKTISALLKRHERDET